MKIIHCSDLHLDSKMQANFDSGKAKERRDEILRTYQKMVEYAAKNDVKIILIAGDMFDKKDITTKAKNVVLNSICANPQIDFIYLKGNHDETIFLDEEENLENLKTFNNQEWKKYDYENITITGIEFGGKKNYEIYNSLILEKNKINIVVMHGQESETELKDKTEIIELKQLKNKNIDYLALGHIHKPNIIGDKVAYSGSLEPLDRTETGEHGYILGEVELGKCIIQHIPFSTREYVHIRETVDSSVTNGCLLDMIKSDIYDFLSYPTNIH